MKFSFSQVLRRAASINRAGTATQFGERALTWRETLERVQRIAGVMRDSGVQAGDRVAILSGNSDFYLQFLFATPWAGGVAVPINTRLAPGEIAYWLNDSGSRLLFVEPAFAALAVGLQEQVPSLELIVCVGEGDPPPGCASLGNLLARAPIAEDAGREGDDLVALFYTGGTSGRSKGVMLTHHRFVLNTMQWLLGVGLTPDDALLIAAPMFHMVAGLNSIGGAVLATRICILPRFDPTVFLQAVERSRATKVALVPAMVDSIIHHPDVARYDLSSLRKISYGGAPMPEGTLRRALEVMPQTGFYQIYGQTESGPNLSVLLPRYHRLDAGGSTRLHSAGQPLPGVEIAILDEDDQPVGPGVRGEICARHPAVAPGYWNLPAETERFLRNGWAHTGDVGYIDEDGFLYIVDRIKDMIISGGENVYSAEVERVLYLHPAIAECAVIGIPHEHWGEQVHAIVRLNAGSVLAESELISFCHQHLGGFKCIRSAAFTTDPLPRSAANKILKRELREPYWVAHRRRV